jgi:protein TonB
MSQKTVARLAATAVLLAAAWSLSSCSRSERSEPATSKPAVVATAPEAGAPIAPAAAPPAVASEVPPAAAPVPPAREAGRTAKRTGKLEPRVTGPVQIARVNPQYPDLCRRQRIEGVVTLKAKVNAEGKIASVDVLDGVHPLLDGAAERAVKQWRYRPAMVDGRPVPSTVKVTVGFRL